MRSAPPTPAPPAPAPPAPAPAGTLRHRTTLPAAAPFDLHQALRVLRGGAPCSGDQVVGPAGVRRALALAGPRGDEAVVVDVAPADAGVSVDVHAARELDAADRRAVEVLVTRWLSLDDDLAPFLAAARADPPMAPVLEATRGLHQVRFASLAEGAAYFVLTQRTSQALAGARTRRLAAGHGPRLVVDGVEHVAFPSLGALAALDPAELARVAGNAQQAGYLVSVVHGLHDLGEEALRALPPGEATAALRALRGVGEFTASAVLLRALGRPEAVSLTMPQVVAVAEALYGPPADLSVVQARYGAHVGWWSYYARIGLGWLGVPIVAAPRRR